MGADLFGSYAEATCAALVIGASCPDLVAEGWAAVVFPMEVSAAGLLVCLLASFLSTDLFPVKEEKDIEWVSGMLAVNSGSYHTAVQSTCGGGSRSFCALCSVGVGVFCRCWCVFLSSCGATLVWCSFRRQLL